MADFLNAATATVVMEPFVNLREGTFATELP